MKHTILIILLIGMSLSLGCVEKIYDTTTIIKGHNGFSVYGIANEKSTIIKYHYIVISSQPVDIYTVPSYSDFNIITSIGAGFEYYPSCYGIQILRYDRYCKINSNGGIAIWNTNVDDSNVDIKIYKYSDIGIEEDVKSIFDKNIRK